jgi:hypothetical protein
VVLSLGGFDVPVRGINSIKLDPPLELLLRLVHGTVRRWLTGPSHHGIGGNLERAGAGVNDYVLMDCKRMSRGDADLAVSRYLIPLLVSPER